MGDPRRLQAPGGVARRGGTARAARGDRRRRREPAAAVRCLRRPAARPAHERRDDRVHRGALRRAGNRRRDGRGSRGARPRLEDPERDHGRILRDAVERVRIDLGLTGIATAFVGPTFTLAELRGVYEEVWGVPLDAANFRRSVLAEEGWVIPTGRRARPGAAGGKPAELYRAGRMWRHGAPIRSVQPSNKRRGNQ